MRMVDVIAKKRDGQALTDAEIRWFIESYTAENIPDYQASALLMAICINGMNPQEVTTLTMAMAESGEILDLSDLGEYVVDKHSSGGVGDKTSLMVLPLVAACGVPVAKMSGRGLGYSGGTLDKLEAIKGFSCDLNDSELRSQAKRIGLAIGGQTKALAPADGKLYALRDVSGTVPSIPLIASSIMSKKIAFGAQGIVLDVKVGTGAFMQTLDNAHYLAELMVKIGTNVGRDVIAVISDMNQPLGHAVGHALEVQEAIETLQGEGPQDFLEHCLHLASYVLRLAGRGERWTTLESAQGELISRLQDRSAFTKFREMVQAQGGDPAMVDDPSLMPTASIIEDIYAAEDGYLSKVDAFLIAKAAFELGAGRVNKGDPIDMAVGVKTLKKVGDSVRRGEHIATLYANDETRAAASKDYLKQAYAYSSASVEPLPLFYDVIGEG